MAKRADITAAQLRAILDYNPDTGEFRWKTRTPDMFCQDSRLHPDDLCKAWNTNNAGKITGCFDSKGYVTITIFKKSYKAHRLAWAIMHGKMPNAQIDHKNLYKSDNRISNLRLAGCNQNQTNKRLMSTNTSGFKGVSWYKARKKWRALIMSTGKCRYLGLFESPDEAHKAYCRASEALHGEFGRTE